jgi:hypothetical protein
MMPSTGDFRKLDGMNYVEWAGTMEAWLVKKGVWGIVSRDETSPMVMLRSSECQFSKKCHASHFPLQVKPIPKEVEASTKICAGFGEEGDLMLQPQNGLLNSLCHRDYHGCIASR